MSLAQNNLSIVDNSHLVLTKGRAKFFAAVKLQVKLRSDMQRFRAQAIIV